MFSQLCKTVAWLSVRALPPVVVKPKSTDLSTRNGKGQGDLLGESAAIRVDPTTAGKVREA